MSELSLFGVLSAERDRKYDKHFSKVYKNMWPIGIKEEKKGLTIIEVLRCAWSFSPMISLVFTIVQLEKLRH